MKGNSHFPTEWEEKPPHAARIFSNTPLVAYWNSWDFGVDKSKFLKTSETNVLN